MTTAASSAARWGLHKGVNPSKAAIINVEPSSPRQVSAPSAHLKELCGHDAEVYFCSMFCVWGAEAHMSGPLLSRRYPCPVLLLHFSSNTPYDRTLAGILCRMTAFLRGAQMHCAAASTLRSGAR